MSAKRGKNVVCYAPKKNGLVSIMCRITVNGKISQFSCKLNVEENLWNVNLGRMSGRSFVAQETNRMLDKIRIGINKAYQEIMDRDGYVSAEKVRNAFFREDDRPMGNRNFKRIVEH